MNEFSVGEATQIAEVPLDYDSVWLSFRFYPFISFYVRVFFFRFAFRVISDVNYFFVSIFVHRGDLNLAYRPAWSIPSWTSVRHRNGVFWINWLRALELEINVKFGFDLMQSHKHFMSHTSQRIQPWQSDGTCGMLISSTICFHVPFVSLFLSLILPLYVFISFLFPSVLHFRFPYPSHSGLRFGFSIPASFLLRFPMPSSVSEHSGFPLVARARFMVIHKAFHVSAHA